MTISILPDNQPPVVNPGTNQTIVLPAISTNVFSTLYQSAIPSDIPNPNGIDYFGESNCVIAYQSILPPTVPEASHSILN